MDQTDHFANVFVPENDMYGYEVHRRHHLFLEIQCKKCTIKCLSSVFSANWAGIR